MLRRICLALLVWGCAGTVAAEAPIGDAAQRAFVARYVAALVDQNIAALKQLYDPATLACINAGNQDFFDFWFSLELKSGPALRAGYTLTRFGPVDPNLVAAIEAGGRFPQPLKSTDEFELNSPLDKKNHSVSVIRTVALRDGSWFLTGACPTAAGLASFREQQTKRAQAEARAKALVGQLREPLLSEVKGLLAKGQKIDAIKRYQTAANVDLPTAVQVINLLDQP
jgi:hypothetical protein